MMMMMIVMVVVVIIVTITVTTKDVQNYKCMQWELRTPSVR